MNSFDNDYDTVMDILSNNTFEPREVGDLFNDSILTTFFESVAGKDIVATLRSEFVSWTDIRVGTIREMMDLGIPRETACQIKTILNGIFREFVNIESVTMEDLASLKLQPEDSVW